MVVPGSTVFVTRRTVGRFHLFAPDPRIRQIYLYTLGVGAIRFDVLLHLIMLMSSHHHLAMTDKHGRRPEFLHFVHRTVALATKVVLGWEGSIWDSAKTSVVELDTPEAIAGMFAYGIANPVAAGLVKMARDWPGVTTRVDELGNAVWRVERPKWWFDASNPDWPDHVEITLTLPPLALQKWTPAEFREVVGSEVSRLEADARAEMRAKGIPFLGVDRCRKLSPFERSKTPEPTRQLCPTFAVGPGQHDARRDAIARMKTFRAAYRARMTTWSRGDRVTPFPFGTWLMKRVHGVAVEPAIAA